MAEITATLVKQLRDETGAGMMDCKKALQDANADVEKARTLLRERGLADAAKRKGREAKEGIIHTYLHTPAPGNPARVGVMVEVSTETDFTAKNEAVRDLANEIALQIAAMKPIYVTADQIPADVIAAERDLAAKKLEGKPDKIIEQAKDGAAKKFTAQFSLYDQKWIKDDKQSIRELVDGLASKTGENIEIRRFVRFELAESLD